MACQQGTRTLPDTWLRPPFGTYLCSNWHASRELLPFRTLDSVPLFGTYLCSNLHASMERLPFRTPGSVLPFWTYLCSNWLASRERLPFRTPGSFPTFIDLLMIQYLRPVFPNLPCLVSTFHFELSILPYSNGNSEFKIGLSDNYLYAARFPYLDTDKVLMLYGFPYFDTDKVLMLYGFPYFDTDRVLMLCGFPYLDTDRVLMLYGFPYLDSDIRMVWLRQQVFGRQLLSEDERRRKRKYRVRHVCSARLQEGSLTHPSFLCHLKTFRLCVIIQLPSGGMLLRY